MAKKKSKVAKTAVPTVSVKKKGTKKNKQRKNKSGNAAAMNYAMLLADPCNGPMVRSVDPHSSTSLIQRTRKIIDITAANGYAIWFPSYTNGAPGEAVNRVYNLYVWQNADPNLRPVNTIANPMGTGGLTGNVHSDPLYPTLADTLGVTSTRTFSRAKTLAACMQLEYTGAISAASGQVAVVKNMSMVGFAGNPIQDLSPRTVSEMFNYAAVRSRLDLAGHEVKWAPTEDSQVLRTPGTVTTSVSHMTKIVDGCIYVPTAGGSIPTLSTAPDISGQTAIVVAWRDLPLTAHLNLYKVAEIEISVTSGMVEEPRKPVVSSVSTAQVVDALYRSDPDWQVGKVVKDSLSHVAKGMAKGVINGIFNTATQAYAPSYVYPRAGRNLRMLGDL